MSGRTILPGTFDGVHLGHRFLIHKAKEVAGDTRITILTFNPHPLFLLGEIKSDFLLTTQNEKDELLLSAGVDEVTTLPFDNILRDMSPKDFWEEILLGKLGMRKIIVGEDFRFGKNREGDVDFLLQLGSLHAVEVFVIPPLKIGNKVVKSDEIRKLLKKGKVSKASKLLGRFYSLRGRVVRGMSLGRKLGFPTANLEIPKEKLKPMMGVYAVKVKVEDVFFRGICYLGKRPTLSASGETVCEVHIFNEDKDFLGLTMEVFLIEAIRKEKKFSSLEELSRQIERDIIEAQQLLSALNV